MIDLSPQRSTVVGLSGSQYPASLAGHLALLQLPVPQLRVRQLSVLWSAKLQRQC